MRYAQFKHQTGVGGEGFRCSSKEHGNFLCITQITVAFDHCDYHDQTLC